MTLFNQPKISFLIRQRKPGRAAWGKESPGEAAVVMRLDVPKSMTLKRALNLRERGATGLPMGVVPHRLVFFNNLILQIISPAQN